jgi:hypothetical protein
MERFRKKAPAPDKPGGASGSQDGLYSAGTPADVTSTRAKSQRHKKSTADKWNQ